MKTLPKLSYSVWDCKYPIVWIPKCRRRKLYGEAAIKPGEVFHELARQCESKIVEGHWYPDHIRMLTGIPPKYGIRSSGVY
jgi:putative transposase